MTLEQFLTSKNEEARKLIRVLLKWDYQLLRYFGPIGKRNEEEFVGQRIWVCLNEKSLIRVRLGFADSWTFHLHIHTGEHLKILISDYQKIKRGGKIPSYRHNLTHSFYPANTDKLIKMINSYNVTARTKVENCEDQLREIEYEN